MITPGLFELFGDAVQVLIMKSIRSAHSPLIGNGEEVKVTGPRKLQGVKVQG